jgi:hypothetical protein
MARFRIHWQAFGRTMMNLDEFSRSQGGKYEDDNRLG